MTVDRRGGTYVPDHVSFGAMMVSEQLRAPLRLVAGLIKTKAAANTSASSRSDSDSDPHAGQLAAGYSTEKGPLVDIHGPRGEPGPRITERVTNRVRYAAAREFGRGGWQNDRGSRDLRRAGEAYGDLQGRGH